MNPGLLNALLVSLLGHAAALAMWSTPPPAPTEMPRLQVQIRQTAAAPAANAPEPARHASASAAPPAAVAARAPVAEARSPAPPARPARRTEPETPATAPPRATREDTSAPEATEQAESLFPAEPAATARPLILARLRAALRTHFTYPMLARRRGWEGRVLVGLRIESGGRIGGIHVARSSGYGVLDRSAVDALSRVQGLPGVETGGRTLELQVPVIYRLQEG